MLSSLHVAHLLTLLESDEPAAAREAARLLHDTYSTATAAATAAPPADDPAELDRLRQQLAELNPLRNPHTVAARSQASHAREPFRTTLQLMRPHSARGSTIGAYVEAREEPPDTADALRYGAAVPETRTPDDLLGVVIGAPVVREGDTPIGLGDGSDRPRRAFAIPRPPRGDALTLLTVVDGDITRITPLAPCATAPATPCAPETTVPADLVLVLPAEDVARTHLAVGWRFVIDP